MATYYEDHRKDSVKSAIAMKHLIEELFFIIESLINDFKGFVSQLMFESIYGESPLICYINKKDPV